MRPAMKIADPNNAPFMIHMMAWFDVSIMSFRS